MPHAQRAVQLLVDTMDNEEAPIKERLYCATQLIDRAYGKAVDRVQVATLAGGSNDAPATLTTAQLIAALRPALEHNPLPDSDTVIVDANETPPAST